ncbi:PREDICTED: uncharacterized protein LOC109238790 [Nicotiana attenuata]|uniref:uncharacterized protein LOC109238790 n=1 Tax=Nicotiana attenuata TaxID=49451 RepID=UPI0009047EF7|nr:PREDICTED: uncharacterized protein LOC109238790 [Nicotiana attenuata]
MAKTSKIVPKKEKASSSRPAGDKKLVEPRIEECVPGKRDLTSDFKVDKPSSVPGHCLVDTSVLRPPPPGEEEAPKPAKDKKRKRVSIFETLKPKKSKAQEEDDKDGDFRLVARRKSVEVPKAAEPAVTEEVQPRAEEGLENAPSRVPQSARADVASHRDA